MDEGRTKHEWNDPVLVDLSTVQLTASGLAVGATEVHCDADGYSYSVTTGYFAPTSSGAVNITACGPPP